MNGISVTLEGEEAIFFWKDGKAYTEGYDLESEKAALALTSFGTGIGVLLVAMNTTCKSEIEFESEIKTFVAQQKIFLSSVTYGLRPQGQLVFEYFSYSSDPKKRWGGLERAHLSENHYKRILKDPEMEIKIMMARLDHLPEKYFKQLVPLSNHLINSALAYNKNCPIEVLEILAQDKVEGVRWRVARNQKCSKGVLEILAKDEDEGVRRYVAQNQHCPESLLEELAQDKDVLVRRYVAQNQNCPESLLGKLAQDDIAVSGAARERLARSKGMEV